MRDPAAQGRLPGLVLFAAFALLAVPVLAVRMPPVLDYPNHFSRIWLLAGGVEAPPASGFYAVDWAGASTNIGTDVLAAALGAAVPATVLAPLFLLAALVLPALGAAALNRAVFGGWHWWQVGFAALAWSTTFLAGFLNFQIAIGLGALAAALNPKVARLPPAAAFACRAGLGAVVLLFHPFGLLFYAAFLAGLALGRDWRVLGSARGVARGGGRALLAAAAAAAPLVAVLLLAPALPGAQAGAEVPAPEWAPFSVGGKLDMLSSGVRTYWRGVDLVPVALVAAPALWALATGRLRAHAGLLLVAVGFVALSVASPLHFRTGSWIAERFAAMAVMAMAAALRPDPVLSRRAGAALAAALLAVSAGRTAMVGWVWRARQADVAAVERALAHLPAGAVLLPMEHTPTEGGRHSAPRGRYVHGVGAYWHLPTLAVPWRQAFVPTLFAMRGKQPVHMLPPWDALAAADGGPFTVSALTSLTEDNAQDWVDKLKIPVRHVLGWRERYDYVLVLNADLPDRAGPAGPVPGLELVADEGFAQLHRVVRGGSAAAAGSGG